MDKALQEKLDKFFNDSNNAKSFATKNDKEKLDEVIGLSLDYDLPDNKGKIYLLKKSYFKHLVKMAQNALKYEEFVIAMASFSEGDEVTGAFDAPDTARWAREVLGVKICKKYI